MIRILFVCLGNICRSPALESVLRDMVLKKGLEDEIEVDSCGIHSYFLTSKADSHIIAAAKQRGIDIKSRAKLFSSDFFETFDYIFVVDKRLLEMLKSKANSKKTSLKVHLATKFSQQFPDQDMPDPYAGSDQGFELTMDIAEDVCKGILRQLENEV